MKTQQGQRGYTVVESVGAYLAQGAGQVVEGRTGGVGVAGAGSTTVVGAAIDLAQPLAVAGVLTASATTDAYGRAVLNASPTPDQVTVVSAGTELRLVYAAAATFGQALIAAANGQVTPAGANPDARTIIARCVQPGGVAANAAGLARML